MPFYPYHTDIARYHAMLSAVPNLAPVHCVVRDSLHHMLAHLPRFNAHIESNSPFVDEFVGTVRSMDTSEDACFALMECLVIFCREKRLRCNGSDSPVEESLLRHFEESGKWNMTDGTLVSEWYWHVLPARCAASAAA